MSGGTLCSQLSDGPPTYYSQSVWTESHVDIPTVSFVSTMLLTCSNVCKSAWDAGKEYGMRTNNRRVCMRSCMFVPLSLSLSSSSFSSFRVNQCVCFVEP